MGDKQPNNEPLKTLMKYRYALNPEEKKFYGSNPFLGVNLSVEVPGKLNVGDRKYKGPNNEDIAFVEQAKDLGLMLSKEGNYRLQINIARNKATQHIY